MFEVKVRAILGVRALLDDNSIQELNKDGKS